MPRTVVLEWDNREARIAIGNVRPEELTVEQAFTVSLDEADDAASIGNRIGAALEEHGAAKLDVMVAIGRSNIELRVLSLPPAPPEDRPDLVRFAAQKEFTALREDWPVDYVELGEAPEGGIQVLAAAIAGNLVRQVREVCRRWEAEPSRLVLRPFAAASLWYRNQGEAAPQAALLVDVLEADVDLTVLVEGRAVFLRTVRLPETEDVAAQAQALVGEMRRTMVAARNQMSGRRVEQIVVFGKSADHEVLLEAAAERLEQEVVAFDPFSVVSIGRKAKQSLPARSGRFAPLLGMLLDEAHGQSHAVDFLHPKRRPEPPSRRNRVLAWSAVAAALLLAAVGYVAWQFIGYARQIGELETRIAQLRPIVEKSETLIRHEQALGAFEQGDVTWLDEVAEIARRIPSAEEMLITDFNVAATREPGGRIGMKGYVKTADLIHVVEDSLRYRNNHVAGKRGTRDASRKDYPWLFDIVVQVPPDRVKFGRPLGRPPVDKKVEAKTGAKTGAPSSQPQEAPSQKRVGGDSAGRLTSTPAKETP